MHGTGRATRAPVAQTLQSVRQTCPCTTATCLYQFARFPSCGIFILTRAIPVKITSCNNRVTVPVTPPERQISCRARAGQHARPSHKHCKACANHAHAPPPRAHTRLHDFHLLGFSHHPVPAQGNNELKQQCDGAGEHLNYDKLRVAGHGPGNTRARRTNTANRAPNMLMLRRQVPVHVRMISILWNFHTNPYQTSETST